MIPDTFAPRRLGMDGGSRLTATHSSRAASTSRRAKTPGVARAYSGCITNLEQERLTMLNRITLVFAMNRHRRNAARLATRLTAVSATALAAILMVSGTASGQSTRSPVARTAADTPTLASGPDLQGLWDFAMRVGERPSAGFFALGPVERGWAGSLTPYLTNTLAIRLLTVDGDSVRMLVASREGDVRFQGRLTDNGRTMQGIVEYHGGVRVPMTATRRAQPVAPR